MAAVMSTRGSSIQHLANLYTVIAGLALATAVHNLISSQGVLLDVSWPKVMLFATFIVTLLPFYHGAMRHLDLAYADQDTERGAAPLLADFAILFLEGCIFIAIAALIREPVFFAWSFVGLLSVDVVWGFLAYLAFSANRKSAPELKWCWINLVTICVLVVYFYFEKIISASPPPVDPFYFSLVILFIASIRTVVDYALTWEMYK